MWAAALHLNMTIAITRPEAEGFISLQSFGFADTTAIRVPTVTFLDARHLWRRCLRRWQVISWVGRACTHGNEV
jgi:hypothetical protein